MSPWSAEKGEDGGSGVRSHREPDGRFRDRQTRWITLAREVVGWFRRWWSVGNGWLLLIGVLAESPCLRCAAEGETPETVWSACERKEAEKKKKETGVVEWGRVCLMASVHRDF